VRRTYRHEVVSTDAGSGLRQPSGRSLHPAALYCLMLYLFELMANATLTKGLTPPIKELNVCSRRSVETAAALLRFLWNTKWGRKK